MANSKRQMRWEPYVLWCEEEFGRRWREHLGARSRDVLIIAGLGFDAAGGVRFAGAHRLRRQW